VAFRRHEPAQKIDEVAREKRVARDIAEPETPPFDQANKIDVTPEVKSSGYSKKRR
jgi:hypothetical protein